ncbi:chaperone SurA [Alphaproteobacteria bacterium]|nr:chaperone SurA [Alphaproteobacteria bacterium]
MRSVICSSLVILLAVFPGISDAACAAKNSAVSDVTEYSGIAAIINDEIITFYDLESRVKFVLLSIGEDVKDNMKAKVYKEVLDEIINEKLKMQYIRKIAPKGITSKKELDESVNDAISDMAKQMNKSPEEFMKMLQSKGINPNVIRSQIEVSLCWGEYIRLRFGKNVDISASELNRICNMVKEKFTQESYCVHRMFFPFSKQSDEAAAASHANNILNMLRNGADFGNLARQFSKSADARKGGELGWVFHGQLSPEEEAALKGMSVGSYAIAKSRKGYFVLYLQDKRESGERSLTDLGLVQVIMPFAQEKPSKDVVDQLMSYINDLTRTSRNARAFIAKAKESGIMGVSDESHSTLEAMQPQFKSLLSSIPQNGFSKPILVDAGILVVCVMNKKVTTLKEPSRDEIKRQKINEKLTIFSERELQDLRKKAVIRTDAKYQQ